MSLINREDVDHVMMPPDPTRAVFRDSRVSYFVTPESADSLLQCPYDPSHWILPARFGTHLLKCRRNYQKGISAGTIRPEPGEEIVVCKWNSTHHIQAKKKKRHEDEECDCNQDKIDADKIRAEIEMTKMRKYFPCGKMPLSWESHLTPADRAVFATFKTTAKQEKGAGFWGSADDAWGAPEHKKREGNKRNEAGLTEEELKNPNDNWEICPIVQKNLERAQFGDGRFTGYDPRVKAAMNRTLVFNNPQGLTKSEKRAFHEKTEELRLAEVAEEARRMNKSSKRSQGDADGGDPDFPIPDPRKASKKHSEQWDWETESTSTLTSDQTYVGDGDSGSESHATSDFMGPEQIQPRFIRQSNHFRPAGPGFPGYELDLDMEEGSLNTTADSSTDDEPTVTANPFQNQENRKPFGRGRAIIREDSY